MIKPKGAKVLVKQLDKENKDNVTHGGIILEARDKDSGDNALLNGIVLEVGTPIVVKGELIKPDVELNTSVFFNRYNAFKVYSKGLDTFWVVDCEDVWAVGEIE